MIDYFLNLDLDFQILILLGIFIIGFAAFFIREKTGTFQHGEIACAGDHVTVTAVLKIKGCHEIVRKDISFHQRHAQLCL